MYVYTLAVTKECLLWIILQTHPSVLPQKSTTYSTSIMNGDSHSLFKILQYIISTMYMYTYIFITYAMTSSRIYRLLTDDYAGIILE